MQKYTFGVKYTHKVETHFKTDDSNEVVARFVI